MAQNSAGLQSLSKANFNQADKKETIEDSAAKTIIQIIKNDEINDWSKIGKEKIATLQESLQLIDKFILSDRSNLEGLSRILDIFSENNLLDLYDYAWRYEEKHHFLTKTVKLIFETIEKELTKNKNASLTTLCRIIYNISLWNFKPTTTLIDKLFISAQHTFKQGELFNALSALQYLSGICLRLDYQLKGNIDTQFITSAIEAALPDLLSENAVVTEAFSSKMHTHTVGCLSRTTKVARFLASVLPKEHQEYQARYNAIFLAFCSGKKTAKEAQQLFLALQKNGIDKLFISLEGMPTLNDSSEGLQITFEDRGFKSIDKDENQFPYGTLLRFDKNGKRVEQNPTYKVIYLDFELLRKHLALLVPYQKPEQHLYKGFMWYLKRFSQNLKWYMKENSEHSIITSATPAFIKGFLAIVRNYACDINDDPEIISGFAKLFKEAIAPYNLETFKNEPNTLLDILWMNMYLSVSLNKSLTYTKQEQSQLFKISTAKLIMSEATARSLYQIQIMGWNGNTPFDKKLTKLMQQQFKKFKLSSNPSKEEQDWYHQILSQTKIQKEHLEHDHICALTGQEIDIAYLPMKLAIHIDGPTHFNSKTGSKTLKTIFRDRCLEKAGWTSIDVNLLLPEDEKKRILNRIIEQINKRQKPLAAAPKLDAAGNPIVLHAYAPNASKIKHDANRTAIKSKRKGKQEP